MDEAFERIETQRIIEERKVSQGRTLNPYHGHAVETKNVEVIKTNQDCWNIR